ncbi:hypothetical protein [Streptomyces sp. NPDC052042]|uniref:hypothetical protein n=1 Tax=Streptomyces sp. NPDC052042 TaxID=3365683 RepID=UPI0037D988C0
MNDTGTAGRGERVREAVGVLVLRFVLLVFWGTPAVLARSRALPPTGGAESVRHKA